MTHIVIMENDLGEIPLASFDERRDADEYADLLNLNSQMDVAASRLRGQEIAWPAKYFVREACR